MSEGRKIANKICMWWSDLHKSMAPKVPTLDMLHNRIESALAEAALRAETPTKHPDIDTIVIAHMKLRRVAKEAVEAMKETLNGATFAKGSTLVRLERVIEWLSGELARAETPAPRESYSLTNPPICPKHKEVMLLSFWDRPGSAAPGNGWTCATCAKERAAGEPEQDKNRKNNERRETSLRRVAEDGSGEAVEV